MNAKTLLTAIALATLTTLTTATAEPASKPAKPAAAPPATSTATKAATSTATPGAATDPADTLAQKLEKLSSDMKEIHDKSLTDCMADGSVYQDDFYAALIGPNSAQPAAALSNLIVCREFVRNTTSSGGPEKYFRPPFFKPGPNTSLSKDDRDKAISKISSIYNDALINTFLVFIMKGETSFLGKTLPEGACSFMPEKSRPACTTNFVNVLNALKAGDSSLCNSATNSEIPARDMCLLFTSKNPELCTDNNFLKPVSRNMCRDFLTLFNAINSSSPDDQAAPKLLETLSPFTATLMEVQFPDGCTTYFRENILKGFCETNALSSQEAFKTKWMAGQKAEEEQLQKELAEVEKGMKLRAEEKKKKEEEEKKKEEEEKKNGKSKDDKPPSGGETTDTGK